VIVCVLAVFFILITGGARVLTGRLSRSVTLPWRGLSITFAFLLLILSIAGVLCSCLIFNNDETAQGPARPARPGSRGTLAISRGRSLYDNSERCSQH